MDRIVVIVIVGFGTVATVAVGNIVARQIGLGEMAAWVQAVGSIAAIYWAGRIARTQMEEARKAHFEQQIHHLIGLEAFLSQHVNALHKAKRKFELAGNPKERYDAAKDSVAAIERAIEVVEKIPSHEAPYAFVAVLLTGIIVELEAGLRAVQKVANGWIRDYEFGVAKEELLNSCVTASFYLSQIVKTTIYHDGKMVPITLG